MMQILADPGAREGGGSTAVAIGQGSSGIPITMLLGGGRPVATYIGMRACYVAVSSVQGAIETVELL
jgi:hypothetical protein